MSDFKVEIKDGDQFLVESNSETNEITIQAVGAPGIGIPTGGTTGQILSKTSGADYATGWTTLEDIKAVWGQITGTLSDQTDLQNALDAKENTSNKATNLLSPDNTKYPTTLAVSNAISAITVPVTSVFGRTGNVTAQSSDYSSFFVQKAGDTMTGALLIDGSANAIQFRIRGHATQTADLHQWQNSASAVLARIDSTGAMISDSLFRLTHTATSRTAGELTKSGDDGILNLYRDGLLDTQIQGNGSSFLGSLSGGNVSIGSSSNIAKLGIFSTNTSTVSLAVRAFASQTANLTQWQDSAANVVASVGASGNVAGPAGSASTPSFTFVGFTNNGIFKPAGDALGFSVASSERMRINSSGNVGIGTTSPQVRLHIVGSAFRGESDSTDATAKSFDIIQGHHTNAQAPFSLFTTISNAAQSIVWIGGGSASYNAATDVRFFTAATNTTLTGTERMRILSDGRVSIGVTSGIAQFGLVNQSAGGVAAVIRGAASQSANLLQFQDATATVLSRVTSSGQFHFNGTTGVAGTTAIESTGGTNSDYISSLAGFNIKTVTAPVAPSGVVSAGGSVNTGDHHYRVTYVTAFGQTQGGPTTLVTTTAGNNTVTLTIPTSSDPRVTGRRIYRSLAGHSSDTGYLLAVINDNTTTTYVDTASDASITSGSPWAGYIPNTSSGYLRLNGTIAGIFDPNLTAFGFAAGQVALTSFAGTLRTVLIGAYAGQNITTGAGNVIIGSPAGQQLTTGGTNTIIGDLTANAATTYNAMVAIGSQTARFIQTGTRSVFLGQEAARYHADGVTQLTSSSNSVYIGANARGFDNNDINVIVIGANTIAAGSNTTVIGTSGTISFTAFGTHIISAPNAGALGIQVRGSAGQTANLIEWQNSSATVLGRVTANGSITMVSGSLTIGNGNASIVGTLTQTGGYPSAAIIHSVSPSMNGTSGDSFAYRYNGGFSPTSGTGTWTGIGILPTINQTGGANGITRGVWVAPTLTSASEFRGIQTTVGGDVVIIGRNTTSATVQIDSTTRGFLPPRMTTTQRNAISSPAQGLVIFNTTTTKLECYDGTTWQACW